MTRRELPHGIDPRRVHDAVRRPDVQNSDDGFCWEVWSMEGVQVCSSEMKLDKKAALDKIENQKRFGFNCVLRKGERTHEVASTSVRARKRSINPSRKSKPHGPNRTEQAYCEHLNLLLHAGVISWYRYEPIKLKLAPDTTYTPDFIVVTKDGVEAHEVKGFERDDAIVKFKCAAEAFPWITFVMMKKETDGWVTTRWIKRRIA